MYFAVARADALGLATRLGDPQQRECPICAVPFREDSVPVSLVSRLGAYQIDVCGWCLQSALSRPTRVAGATRESTIRYLQDLAVVLDEPPSYRWSQAHETLIGMPTEQRVRVVQLWKSRLSARRITELFGSYQKALAAANLV